MFVLVVKVKCDVCVFVFSAAEQAQRVVKIKMNFPSSVFCNNAGKNVLDKRIREALQKLNKNWNFCINTVEGRSSLRYGLWALQRCGSFGPPRNTGLPSLRDIREGRGEERGQGRVALLLGTESNGSTRIYLDDQESELPKWLFLRPDGTLTAG